MITKRKDVVEMLLQVGFKPNLCGFEYTVDAILYTISNNKKKNVCKMYQDIADKHNTTAYRVERGIRNARETSKNIKAMKMCNSEFISRVALAITFKEGECK